MAGGHNGTGKMERDQRVNITDSWGMALGVLLLQEGIDVNRGRWEEYDHSDQEMNVYEQSCANCTNINCPMMLPETAEEHYEEYGTLEDFDEYEAEEKTAEVLQRRKEDAIIRDDEPTWCIYWKGRYGRR